MKTPLIDNVKQFPGAAEVAFDRLDAAFNLVFPGSTTHERYREIGETGLAAVVAPDRVPPGSYSFFEPDTPKRVSLMADNRQAHPDAWAPQDTDEAILGAAIPDSMGRFTAYALSKINALTYNNFWTSVLSDRKSIAPGRIGLAGGRRLGGAIIGISGLWEVHDHVMGQVFVDEIDMEVSGETTRNVDDLAGEVDEIINRIQWLHLGEEAADLSRDGVANLVIMSDGIMTGFRAARGRT